MSLTHSQALQRVIEHREIFYDEMLELMRDIMSGRMSPVMMAAFVAGLRVKKETVGEISACASVMRDLATKVVVAPDKAAELLDIVGTGGDGASTFNISTASAFVAAAGGARVAKHGGKGVSSSSGSADVLEALGVRLQLAPEQVAKLIETVGVGFMFAPNHHSAMKHAAPVRKELGVRTIFNILGPLTNPAMARRHLIGVFHQDLVGIMVRVLQRLGAERAVVVYGEDGLDEVSLFAPTLVGELRDGQVREYEIKPRDFDVKLAHRHDIRVESVQQSAQMVQAALQGKHPAASDIVALNAGAALYAGGIAPTIAEGVGLARAQISSGAAYAKLQAFAEASRTVTL